MVILTIANAKGGVGKTAIAVQKALYCADLLKKRVLFIDLDNQGNASNVLRTAKGVQCSPFTSDILLTEGITGGVNEFNGQGIYLVPASGALRELAATPARYSQYAENLQQSLKNLQNGFDICIMDTGPNPDIRQTFALMLSDFMVAPIQVNQEAIEGIGSMLTAPEWGVQAIQEIQGVKLKFLGILPNMLEPTNFQRENLRALVEQFPQLLIKLDRAADGKERGYAVIKRSTVVPEAQAEHEAIWRMRKTSAREFWKHLEPVFQQIAKQMGVLDGH
ncbi:ParA family protein [Lautropia mirabilis]